MTDATDRSARWPTLLPRPAETIRACDHPRVEKLETRVGSAPGQHVLITRCPDCGNSATTLVQP